MPISVEQQIEKIIDEGDGASRQVLVQMKPTDGEIDKIAAACAKTLDARRSLASARDIMPPRAASSGKGVHRSAAPGEQRHLSMAAQMSRRGRRRSGMARQKSQCLAGLKPLLKTDIYTTAAKQHRRAKREGAPLALRHFWSASSVFMDVDKDSLASLIAQSANVVGVYENRIRKLPPVTLADESRLPTNITDNKTSAWGVQAVNAMSVWGAYGAAGEGVTVAILDTGLDAEHPDLAGRLAPNGFAEFDASGNRVAGVSPYDSGQHGTHVAGTVAGQAENGRWIGVAPDARIAAGLVLKEGAGTDAQILAGIEWAIESGFDIINMSLGGFETGALVQDTYTLAMLNANRAGIPVVVAIGNDGRQTSGTPGNDMFAYAVGATDARDAAAGFSGGRTQVVTTSNVLSRDALPYVYSKPDVCAPGTAVRSTVPDGGYASWNGTSMATPHVAGAMALLLSATSLQEVDPAERAFLIQDLMSAGVEELGEAGHDHRFGLGRIDALRSVGFAYEREFGL
ncbi:MAG: S8 family serine peptidase [Gammaproteobacteria bacterium]